MSIKEFLGKKRNIVITYDIADLREKLTPMELVVALHFLNKISSNNGQNSGENTVIVAKDLGKYSKEQMFELFLVYLENSIINYKKYENDKIKQFLFFLDGYASLFGEKDFVKYPSVNSLFKDRILK